MRSMHTDPLSPRQAAPRRLLRACAVTGAALACVAALSACGSSKSTTTEEATTGAKLNTARVAKSIEESIRTERHIVSKVTCPASVPQEKGRTFVCTAKTHVAKTGKTLTTPFTVKIETNRGYVTYVGG
jgi:Domain of unknown function (DUF4333)